MFELLNSQRICFGLSPVEAHWVRMEVKASPHDAEQTYLYLDGDTIVKCVTVGSSSYSEWDLWERVDPGKTHLLPKTAKGKPVLLSASTIQKRAGVGMSLNYSGEHVHLYNETTQCSYYFNSYLEDDVCDLDSFAAWVRQWCEETTEADIGEITAFSKETRRHIRYREGDVFRFKIGRRLYGYGRILLDYGAMRKRKQPFWDILMGKSLVCSVYHIVTERRDVSVEELKNLPSLPSTIIMDNALYYGEYPIIGNLAITPNEDYPILYGNSIHVGQPGVCYQQGTVFMHIEDGEALYPGFINNSVAFNLNVKLNVLAQCIEEGSNDPYWALYHPYPVERDLRNPIHAQKLQRIRSQFGL